MDFSNSIKILQHNVLAWTYQRRNELTNYYLEEDPDIILINAHGIKTEDKLKIHNYMVHKINIRNEPHDGAAIAVKKNIKYRILDTYQENFLAIIVTTTLGEVCIATGYQPPRRPWLNYDNFLTWARLPIPTYFIGDVNARHQQLGNNDNNNNGRFIAGLIRDNKFVHMGPDFKTFLTNRAASTPDIILNNNKHCHNIHIQQGKVTTSDHLPVIVQLSGSPIQLPTPPQLDLKNAKWEDFKNELSTHTYVNLNGEHKTRIDEEMSKWFRTIQDAMKKHIPTRRHRTIPHPHNTPEITALKAEFRQLLVATQNNWTYEKRRQFTEIQNRLQEACNEAREVKWNELLFQIETDKKDPQKFWGQVKKLMGNESTSSPYILDNDGHKIYDADKQAEIFTRHWKNVFQISVQENSNFCQRAEEEILDHLNMHRECITPYETIDLGRLDPGNPVISPINIREVKRTIMSFRNKKAPGESKINKEILMQLPDTVLHHYTHIINAALATGIFPRDFKHAIIKMLTKTGKTPTLVANYRPISLLETAAKLFEKIINSRLRNYLEDNNHNNTFQHSYRKHRGTSTAIALLYEQIANSQAHREQCSVVFRDVSKAFDKVYHPGLKYKILRLELPRCLTALLCNFIENRTAAIKIGHHTGETFQLHSGVPQGSTLSPTLFNLYVSDVGQLLRSEYIQYADDITQLITYHGKSKEFMKRKTESAITELNSYEKRNKIQTNKNKFQILHVSKHNPPPVRIDNEIIQYTPEATVLGLKLTRYGLRAHIKERKGKAGRALKKLKRFSKLHSNTKMYLYKALVLPILTYPAVPLNTLSKSNMLNLQAVQNKALRWVEAAQPPYENTIQELHNKWKLEPLNRRIYNLSYNVWEKVRTHIPDEWAKVNIDTAGATHKWWPKAIMQEEYIPPEPLYIKQHTIPQHQLEDDDSE